MKTRDQPRRTNFRSSSQEQNRSPGEGESSGDLGLPPLPRCIPTSSLIPLSLQPPTSHHLLWKLFPVHLQHHFNSFHSHWPFRMHYYPAANPNSMPDHHTFTKSHLKSAPLFLVCLQGASPTSKSCPTQGPQCSSVPALGTISWVWIWVLRQGFVLPKLASNPLESQGPP